MRMIDPLLMEFDREAETTKKVIARIPDDKLSWKPHEKSMALGALAHHVATVPGWIGSTLLLEGFDFATGGAPPSAPGTTTEILAAFDKSTQTAKDAMSQLDDAKAVMPWTLSKGGATIMTMPKIALVRTILLNHTIHHRGQLSVYLRLLDIPVPSIYGPSADENPFG